MKNAFKYVCLAFFVNAINACGTTGAKDPCAASDRAISAAALIENSLGNHYERCLGQMRTEISLQ